MQCGRVKMKKKFLPCFLLTSAMAVNAQAEGFYARVDSGVSMTKKLSDGTSEKFYGGKKAKHGAVYGFGVGYQFNDKFRMDLNLSQRKHKFSRSGEKIDDDGDLTKFVNKQKITSNSIMLNGYYDILKYKKFTPCVTAGIGFAKNKGGGTTRDESIFAAGVFAASGSAKYIGKNVTRNFAWNIGIGTNYSVTDNIQLNFGYKYSDLGKVKTPKSRANTVSNPQGQAIFNAEQNNILSSAKLKMHSFSLGLKCFF